MPAGGDLNVGEKGARVFELLVPVGGALAGADNVVPVVVRHGGDGCACETGLAGGGILDELL